jgi:hypothetical protein
MFGAHPCGPRKVCSMHHSYSSSLSPFQAKTGMPRAAIAAARCWPNAFSPATPGLRLVVSYPKGQIMERLREFLNDEAS